MQKAGVKNGDLLFLEDCGRAGELELRVSVWAPECAQQVIEAIPDGVVPGLGPAARRREAAAAAAAVAAGAGAAAGGVGVASYVWGSLTSIASYVMPGIAPAPAAPATGLAEALPDPALVFADRKDVRARVYTHAVPRTHRPRCSLADTGARARGRSGTPSIICS